MYWEKLIIEKIEKCVYLIIEKSTIDQALNIITQEKKHLLVGHRLLQCRQNNYKIVYLNWIKEIKYKKVYLLKQRPNLPKNFNIKKLFIYYPELQYGL